MSPSPARDLTGRNVFITGAASGIGRATAVACAQQGAVLFLTDIDDERLAEAAAVVTEAGSATGGTVAWSRAGDISDREAVEAMARDIGSQYGAMDIVMNVAGIAEWGTISAMPHEGWQRLINVNLMGPIHVMEYFVPAMVDAGRGGHVVNVSSAAGIIGMPWHAAYSASKFGLRGVSEVLRFDLRKHGIRVSLVCPGGVDTGLTSTIRIAGVDKDSRRFQKSLERFRSHAVTPEQAADAILRGMRRGRYWIYTSLDIRLVHSLQRHLEPVYVLAMRGLNYGANRSLPQVERARRQELP
jgi:NAD(P)-dependent dehydrogenase (short-subunit alcohol dehydrogenase family)